MAWPMAEAAPDPVAVPTPDPAAPKMPNDLMYPPSHGDALSVSGDPTVGFVRPLAVSTVMKAAVPV